jgi:hypothetical protein
MRLSGIIIPNGGKNTVKGAHGYYYANAKKMSRFFKAHIKGPGVKIKYNDYVKYGIVFQNGGFRNASGHVDVIYNGKAAGTSDGMLYSTPKSTTLWR